MFWIGLLQHCLLSMPHLHQIKKRSAQHRKPCCRGGAAVQCVKVAPELAVHGMPYGIQGSRATVQVVKGCEVCRQALEGHNATCRVKLQWLLRRADGGSGKRRQCRDCGLARH